MRMEKEMTRCKKSHVRKRGKNKKTKKGQGEERLQTTRGEKKEKKGSRGKKRNHFFDTI